MGRRKNPGRRRTTAADAWVVDQSNGYNEDDAPGSSFVQKEMVAPQLEFREVDDIKRILDEEMDMEIIDVDEGSTKNDLEEPSVATPPVSLPKQRPLRAKRMVDRFVEFLRFKESVTVKRFHIKKGPGMPLRNIPKVASWLEAKSDAEVKTLFQILFRCRAKSIQTLDRADLINYVLRYSGFPPCEDEAKQHKKMKEKLERCTKDMLLELLDLFCLPGSKDSKKEEMVLCLTDFLGSPCARAEMSYEETQPYPHNWKRKRGHRRARCSPEKSEEKLPQLPQAEDACGVERPEEIPLENADADNGLEDVVVGSIEGQELHMEGECSGLPPENERENFTEVQPTLEMSARKSSRKVMRRMRSASVTPKSCRRIKGQPSELEAEAPEVGSPESSVLNLGKGSSVTPSDDSKSAKSYDSLLLKPGDTKRDEVMAAVAMADSKEPPGPGMLELKAAICTVLNKVNFMTVTFADVLQAIDEYFGLDLSGQKAVIKLWIEEEVVRLSDEADREEELNSDSARLDKECFI